MTKEALQHARLGHADVRRLREIQKRGLVLGIDMGAHAGDICTACKLGKATATPYNKRQGKRASKLLEIMHVDMWGPAAEPSHEGQR